MAELPSTQIFALDYSPEALPPNHTSAVLKSGDHQFDIVFGPNLIGRDPLCDIVLNDGTVSKHHATIEREEDIFIFDSRSSNRTKLGRTYLKPFVRYQLTNGSKISFGNVHCTILIENTDNNDNDAEPTLSTRASSNSTLSFLSTPPCSFRSANTTDQRQLTNGPKINNAPHGQPQGVFEAETQRRCPRVESQASNSPDIFEQATEKVTGSVMARSRCLKNHQRRPIPGQGNRFSDEETQSMSPATDSSVVFEQETQANVNTRSRRTCSQQHVLSTQRPSVINESQAFGIFLQPTQVHDSPSVTSNVRTPKTYANNCSTSHNHNSTAVFDMETQRRASNDTQRLNASEIFELPTQGVAADSVQPTRRKLIHGTPISSSDSSPLYEAETQRQSRGRFSTSSLSSGLFDEPTQYVITDTDSPVVNRRRLLNDTSLYELDTQKPSTSAVNPPDVLDSSIFDQPTQIFISDCEDNNSPVVKPRTDSVEKLNGSASKFLNDGEDDILTSLTLPETGVEVVEAIVHRNTNQLNTPSAVPGSPESDVTVDYDFEEALDKQTDRTSTNGANAASNISGDTPVRIDVSTNLAHSRALEENIPTPDFPPTSSAITVNDRSVEINMDDDTRTTLDDSETGSEISCQNDRESGTANLSNPELFGRSQITGTPINARDSQFGQDDIPTQRFPVCSTSISSHRENKIVEDDIATQPFPSRMSQLPRPSSRVCVKVESTNFDDEENIPFQPFPTGYSSRQGSILNNQRMRTTATRSSDEDEDIIPTQPFPTGSSSQRVVQLGNLPRATPASSINNSEDEDNIPTQPFPKSSSSRSQSRPVPAARRNNYGYEDNLPTKPFPTGSNARELGLRNQQRAISEEDETDSDIELHTAPNLEPPVKRVDPLDPDVDVPTFERSSGSPSFLLVESQSNPDEMIANVSVVQQRSSSPIVDRPTEAGSNDRSAGMPAVTSADSESYSRLEGSIDSSICSAYLLETDNDDEDNSKQSAVPVNEAVETQVFTLSPPTNYRMRTPSPSDDWMCFGAGGSMGQTEQTPEFEPLSLELPSTQDFQRDVNEAVIEREPGSCQAGTSGTTPADSNQASKRDAGQSNFEDNLSASQSKRPKIGLLCGSSPKACSLTEERMTEERNKGIESNKIRNATQKYNTNFWSKDHAPGRSVDLSRAAEGQVNQGAGSDKSSSASQKYNANFWSQDRTPERAVDPSVTATGQQMANTNVSQNLSVLPGERVVEEIRKETDLTGTSNSTQNYSPSVLSQDRAREREANPSTSVGNVSQDRVAEKGANPSGSANDPSQRSHSLLWPNRPPPKRVLLSQNDKTDHKKYEVSLPSSQPKRLKGDFPTLDNEATTSSGKPFLRESLKSNFWSDTRTAERTVAPNSAQLSQNDRVDYSEAGNRSSQNPSFTSHDASRKPSESQGSNSSSRKNSAEHPVNIQSRQNSRFDSTIAVTNCKSSLSSRMLGFRSRRMGSWNGNRESQKSKSTVQRPSQSSANNASSTDSDLEEIVESPRRSGRIGTPIFSDSSVTLSKPSTSRASTAPAKSRLKRRKCRVIRSGSESDAEKTNLSSASRSEDSDEEIDDSSASGSEDAGVGEQNKLPRRRVRFSMLPTSNPSAAPKTYLRKKSGVIRSDSDSQEMTENSMASRADDYTEDCFPLSCVAVRTRSSLKPLNVTLESVNKKKDKNSDSGTRLERPVRSCSGKDRMNVAFSGPLSDSVLTCFRQLGGIETEIETAEVLVAESVLKTVKFLSAVARGIPIVKPQWITNSKSAGRWLDPWDYILKDEEAERRWGFNLKTTLQKAQDVPLLNGFHVCASLNTKPPPNEILQIARFAGALVLNDEPITWPAKSLLLTKKLDQHLWPARAKSLKVLDTEFLVSALLQHKLLYKPYLLR